MLIETEDWLTVAELAKLYILRKGPRTGQHGVARQYINDLVAEERKAPGSTDIEHIEISGVTFVKYRTMYTVAQLRNLAALSPPSV